LIHKVVEAIASTDVVVVEVSEATPSVMLELGVSYALRKRTVLLFNRENDRAIENLEQRFRTVDIVTYSFEAEHLKAARDAVYQRSQTPLDAVEAMDRTILGAKLRPKRGDPKGVFLYFNTDRELWKAVLPKVRRSLDGSVNVYVPSAAPANSLSLEQVIFCSHLASKELPISCFIDTSSGAGSADLTGAFALGVAAGLKRGALRLEEAGCGGRDSLSLWLEPFAEWRSSDDIVDQIRHATQHHRPRKPRR
jgi:hypothetical protein